ncbi:hypothetical protein GNX16_09340 [Mesorhizobium japonicum]|nr:hypothetical protein [Mesorhizobium japonicum]
MKIVIEFYRTRDADDAHAVVGREAVEVDDLNGAIVARGHLRSRARGLFPRPPRFLHADGRGFPLGGSLC